MAQTASATLKSKAQATSRTVSVLLQIAWGSKGSEWPSNWTTGSTDETTRLRSVSWDRRIDMSSLMQGRGGGVVAQMDVQLDNHDQRFSPLNSGGALYSSLSADTSTPGGESVRYPTMWSTPVRLSMGFYDAVNGHERVVVFSGIIDAVQENYGTAGDTVTLTVLDRGALLLQQKASTTVRTDAGSGSAPSINYSTGNTVDTWIRLLCLYGGISTGATFDRGLHVVPYLWLDDENLWSEAQLAAGSEAGAFFFDETGTPYFRNATWWVTAADSLASQATFTTARLSNILPGYDYKQLSTGALVQYQPRSNGGEQVLWQRDGIVVPPSGETIDMRFSHPALLILDPTKGTDWFPVSAGGIDISGLVEVEIPKATAYAQRAQLAFTNSSNQTAFVAKMKVRGIVLSGGPQEEFERNVDTPLVPENQKVIGGNAYIQTNAQAELLATLAASQNSYPRLTYQISGAPALPWLQLGDMVTIDVSDPVTADRYAIITGLSFSWQPDGAWLMNVEAVDKAALFDYDDYHVLGADDYGEGVAFV